MPNEYSLKPDGNDWNGPSWEGKYRVNYCFKHSCEINETLSALFWFKRSLPTVNRLFNQTQLELCVCSSCPSLSAVASASHASRQLLASTPEQMNAGC